MGTEQMAKLTSLEISGIVTNILKHLQIVNSSVTHMNKHLKSKKQELLSDNITLQKCLVEQCNEALQCSKSLQSDVQMLHNDAVSMFTNVKKEQGDNMKNSVGSRTRYFFRRYFP